MRIKDFLIPLLLLGLVDQINGDIAVIEYESKGKLLYSEVDLSLSACIPKEGERVAFFKDYKVVTCGIDERARAEAN